MANGVKAASKSSIEISFTYRGIRCRERVRLPPTPQNLKKVENHRAAIMDAIYRQTFDYEATFPESKKLALFSENVGDVILIKDALDEWMKGSEPYFKSSTIRNYWKIINGRLVPEFGDYMLSEVTRYQVKKWCMSLNVSNKTMANMLSPLKSVLAEAYEDDIIEVDPLAGWSFRDRSKRRKPSSIDPFTQAEQAAIISATPYQENKNMIAFMFWTGLRTSELIALEWGDIDWLEHTARINKARTQGIKVAESTKTFAGDRHIKVLPPALKALKAQKQHTFLANKEIFLDPVRKEAWTGDQAIRRKVWIPALKKAGVRYRYPYQTRHTFASMMISSGENIRWLANHMGHANMAVTLRVYAKWLNDADPDAGMRAVSKFSEVKDLTAPNAGIK